MLRASSNDSPPSLQPQAAKRWFSLPRVASPWLHEEVGSRMLDRLDLIRMRPTKWSSWEPVLGGLAVHSRLRSRYPLAECFLSHVFDIVQHPRHFVAIFNIANRSVFQRIFYAFKSTRWGRAPNHLTNAPPESVDMVWANMLLHNTPFPMALIQRWHASLKSNGFVMFSALGPDSLHELRTLYAQMGWGPAGADLTDMHDWGDMLVAAGFAEPVLDMERITLTYTDAQSLLTDLKSIGCNFHVGRRSGLRARAFRHELLAAIDSNLRSTKHGGQLVLTFEVIYGHAIKPPPRLAVSPVSFISLKQMREQLAHPA